MFVLSSKLGVNFLGSMRDGICQGIIFKYKYGGKESFH